jgi:hypothetical protein
MPSRDFTVRITADGRIIFDMTGLPEDEIRLQRDLAEEMLGRIVAEGTPGDPPDPGHVSAVTPEEERERLRRRGRA